MIKNRNIGWKWKTEFIPVKQFTGMCLINGGALTNSSSTFTLKGFDGSGHAAAEVVAAADTAVHLWTLPSNVDTSHDIYIRLLFSTDSADADVATWSVVYEKVTFPQVLTAEADVNDALDTAIAAQTCTATADIVEWTPAGKISGGTIGSAVDALQLKVSFTYAGDGNEVWFHGMQVAYVPDLTGTVNYKAPELTGADTWA